MNPANSQSAAKLHVRKKRIENAIAFYKRNYRPLHGDSASPMTMTDSKNEEMYEEGNSEDYTVLNRPSHEIHQVVLSYEALQAMTVVAIADLQIQLTEVLQQIESL